MHRFRQTVTVEMVRHVMHGSHIIHPFLRQYAEIRGMEDGGGVGMVCRYPVTLQPPGGHLLQIVQFGTLQILVRPCTGEQLIPYNGNASCPLQRIDNIIKNYIQFSTFNSQLFSSIQA